MRRTLIILVALCTACGETDYEKQRRLALTEPCRDKAVLLATTAGTRGEFECPNRLHKMRVEVATEPSNEEAAAVVFCECQKPNPTTDEKEKNSER